MKSQTGKVEDGGKLAIRAHVPRELGMQGGDTVIVDPAEGELHVRSLSAAIRRAQDIVREVVPKGRTLSDELIADRRAEAAGE